MLYLVATSKAYQSSQGNGSNMSYTTHIGVSSDKPTVNFTYRGPIPRRLTAEQFLDAVWQITGAAPKTIDAPVVRSISGDVRMVRASLLKSDFLMRSLGRPMREQIVSMRPSDLTTLEAIDLSNGSTLAAYLSTGATSLAADWNNDRSGLIDHIFRFALSRAPGDEERQLLEASLSPQPSVPEIEDLLWSVFMLPEFMLNR